MKKVSKILAVFLAAIFSITSFSITGVGLLEVWASGEMTDIYLDGNKLEFSQPESIIKEDDVFLAPVEELAFLTGASAEIDTTSISFTNDMLNLNVVASVGSNTISVNGTERIISNAPKIIGEIVMFPVKDFFYTMNCSVKWDKFNKRIIADSPLANVYKSGDLVIHKAAEAPVLDGADTDSAWSGASLNSGFSTVFYMDEPESDTSFKVTYDDNFLYFFIRCEGAPVPLEGVSIFIAPSDSIVNSTPYYNAVLIPDPSNTTVVHDGKARTDGLGIHYGGGLEYTLAKNKGYYAEYGINESEWTAEVKIPFAKLVPSETADVPYPSNSAEWKFNITRVRPYTETASSWAPIRNSIYGDNLIESDMSYSVNFRYAPITNRTSSIFYEEYPKTTVFGAAPISFSTKIPQNASLRYMGFDTKLICFDNDEVNLDIETAGFYAEWVGELGNKSKAEILNITEKDSKLYFIVKHPYMLNDGLYKLNIYIKNSNISRYEMMFDRQLVVDAGAVYNSLVVDTQVLNKTILQNKSEEEISNTAKALIRIMPEAIGYILNGSPAAGTISYDPVTDSLFQTSGGVETLRVTRTKNEDGSYSYTTTPEKYKNNGILALTSRTGKEVNFGYYEDESGKRYFLDAQLNGRAEDYLKGQLSSLVKTDPVGAAYVLYYLAKAYQDWMPKYDYLENASPVQWSWGPPFGHFGGIFNRWNFEELDDLKTYAPVYGNLRKTNALDIVSENVGEDADKLIARDMFHDDVQFFNMFPNQHQNMNYKSWQGLVVLGRNTGNPDYVHQAMNMVDAYAKNGFLLDGFWKEVTLSYHTQSLSGTNDTLNYLKGWSDPAGYISPRTGMNVQNLDMGDHYPVFKSSNLIQNTVVYPTGRFFPIQDTWETGSGTVANIGSILMPAANIARMSKGEGSATSQLYMTYAPRYGSHVHYDPLSLALWSNGQELLPDLGYTHSQLHFWSLSTLGHNTVVVDSKDAIQPDAASYGGKVENYANIDNTVQVMKASQENAYPGIANEYDREPWYIKMEGSDESYVLDIFRVNGGNRHEYTLNGDATSKTSSFTTDIAMQDYNDGLLLPAGTVVTPPTKETEKGSAVYGGEELYYAYAMVQDVDVNSEELVDGKYEITMVTNDGTANTAGMKITGFAGDNSQLFVGKAPSVSGLTQAQGLQEPKVYMPKMVVRRDGTDLQSTFINVMEPYAADSSAKITSIEKLETPNPKDVAVKVIYPSSLFPGRNITDVIISNSNPSVPLTVEDITLNGKMAFLRYMNDELVSVYTIEADSIDVNGSTIKGEGKYTGKVISTLRKAESSAMDAFIVGTSVPETAVGKTITITHPDGSVHAFVIKSVTPRGENTIVEIKDYDPGINIFEDGTSNLVFFPNTSWEGDHTFNIAMDSYFDTGAIAKRTKQGLTYYTAAKRSNAINNVGQGYSWAVEAKNSATSAADPYALKSFEELWTMVTVHSHSL